MGSSKLKYWHTKKTYHFLFYSSANYDLYMSLWNLRLYPVVTKGTEDSSAICIND